MVKEKEKIMTPKLPYIIYLIAVLILVAPAFLASNTNTKILFKNIALWGDHSISYYFLYQIFWIAP